MCMNSIFLFLLLICLVSTLLLVQPQGFPRSITVKNLPAKSRAVRDASLIPGLGRSSGEENGNPLQYSCLENPKYRGVWRGTVHRIAQSQTELKRLSMHSHKNSRGAEGEPPPPDTSHLCLFPCLLPLLSSRMSSSLPNWTLVIHPDTATSPVTS